MSCEVIARVSEEPRLPFQPIGWVVLTCAERGDTELCPSACWEGQTSLHRPGHLDSGVQKAERGVLAKMPNEEM